MEEVNAPQEASVEGRSFYAYLLQCADGTLYAGWTTDPQKRLLQHNRGTGAKYTRSRCPVILLHAWSFLSQGEAMRFEAHLKKLPRTEKHRLALEAAQLGHKL
jgi:putative endonuclease